MRKGADAFEGILFALAAFLTLYVTNGAIYLWNMLIATMSQVINTTILFTEPVPECIRYKKRMVFGSVLQLFLLLALMHIKHYNKELQLVCLDINRVECIHRTMASL